jgi:dienelactone hydrolase
MPSHGQYTVEKVQYPSHGETIAGVLFRPINNITNPPGIVVTGPYSFMKEQAPLQYATRLADEGYAALIFDPRTVGESTGQPRRLENPKMKNEDMVAGLDYLSGRGDVDASRLFLVGICQGGPQSLDVASYDSRVVGVASVTGYYRDHETDIYMICAGCVAWEPGVDIAALKMPTAEQGEALYKARHERAKQARELYDKTGQVVYQPLVDPKAADPNTGSLAGLPGPVVWAWYGPWTMKGFENRYAVMSDLDHFDYTTVPGVAKLKKPALLIHGDNCMNAAAAKRHYESIPTSQKKLIWKNEFSHFQHYEQPDCVDSNVGEIAAWFAEVK